MLQFFPAGLSLLSRLLYIFNFPQQYLQRNADPLNLKVFSGTYALHENNKNSNICIPFHTNVGRIKQINWPLSKVVVATDDTWCWLSSASHPQVVSRNPVTLKS
ncbi:putative 3-dehydroquinate synthase [Trichinella spiralis]|uniref:putative 3-dehydroquinate synthase n=1 Tax=Trichinella spiralis TaxID=6334 RepID=UPI0001EFB51C|nr:putative 3-dehydroquinate synthase [Trichinella spiralis]